VTLDGFEAASRVVELPSLRPRLEHAQMVTGGDVERAAKLGGMLPTLAVYNVAVDTYRVVIASVQPAHAYVTNHFYVLQRTSHLAQN
jgi:predicted amidohydrolase YtcJ